MVRTRRSSASPSISALRAAECGVRPGCLRRVGCDRPAGRAAGGGGLGETVLVIGLGLIGQIAVGLLAASGCRVIGTDPDAAKCEGARRMGVEIARPGMTGADARSAHRRAGGRRCPHHGVDLLQWADRPGRGGRAEEGAGRARGRRGARTRSPVSFISKRPSSSSPAPTDRAATMPNTRTAGTIIRRRTSVGPRSGTSRPFWI